MRNDYASDEFRPLAPAGYYVALRVGFACPVEVRNGLPPDWVDRYTKRGLMIQDPVMHWVHSNTGAARWCDIDLPDPRGVFGQAREFGLVFGAVVCFAEDGPAGQRSFGTFARGDRNFTEAEIADLSARLEALHIARTPPTNLTFAELEALRLVKDGLLMKEIANFLQVTEGAVKQRLRNAKNKLNAKNSTQAATLATSFGLI